MPQLTTTQPSPAMENEDVFLMQGAWPTPKMVDENFRMVLRNMQRPLEDCTEDVAAIRAQQMGRTGELAVMDLRDWVTIEWRKWELW